MGGLYPPSLASYSPEALPGWPGKAPPSPRTRASAAPLDLTHIAKLLGRLSQEDGKSECSLGN